MACHSKLNDGTLILTMGTESMKHKVVFLTAN